MSSTAGVPGGVPVEGEGRGRDVGGALEGGAGDAEPVLPGAPGAVVGPGQGPPVSMRLPGLSGPAVLAEGVARDVFCGAAGESGEPGVPEGLRREPWDDGLPVSPSSGISRTPPVGGTTPERDVPGPAAPVAT
ncbi:hypothetical protein [Streptomyces syringium]|uniref:hypothetical protein n=1 Tax=Streptomyces syringium TaxID=76729 RepID=UPI003447BDC1